MIGQFARMINFIVYIHTISIVNRCIDHGELTSRSHFSHHDWEGDRSCLNALNDPHEDGADDLNNGECVNTKGLHVA